MSLDEPQSLERERGRAGYYWLPKVCRNIRRASPFGGGVELVMAVRSSSSRRTVRASPTCRDSLQGTGADDLNLQAVVESFDLAFCVGGEGRDNINAQEIHHLASSAPTGYLCHQSGGCVYARSCPEAGRRRGRPVSRHNSAGTGRRLQRLSVAPERVPNWSQR